MVGVYLSHDHFCVRIYGSTILFEKKIVARDAAEFQVELPPASTHLYFTGPARLLPAGE